MNWRIWSYKHPWICHQCWQSETCCTGIRCHFWEKEGKKSWQKNRHRKQQWRWKQHIHCPGDGVVMLLLRGAFCASGYDDSSSSFLCCFVCACVLFWVAAGRTIDSYVQRDTHTHTQRPIDHRLRSVSNAATPRVSKSSVRRRERDGLSFIGNLFQRLFPSSTLARTKRRW
jgi:hypothetical protein